MRICPRQLQAAAYAVPYEKPRLNAVDARVLLEHAVTEREGADAAEALLAQIVRLRAVHDKEEEAARIERARAAFRPDQAGSHLPRAAPYRNWLSAGCGLGSAADAAGAMAAITAAVAVGEITPGEAVELAKLVEASIVAPRMRHVWLIARARVRNGAFYLHRSTPSLAPMQHGCRSGSPRSGTGARHVFGEPRTRRYSVQDNK
jgi:hypothetical protein